MEFYKEGRVLTVATGTTLDLSASQYNHKAAVIVSEAATTGDLITIKFFSKGAKSAGVTFGPPAYISGDFVSTQFTNGIIPVRLSEISTVGTANPIRVTLFN
jgi:hypothetical protein